MKPAPFKYVAASSLEHALSLKAEHGDEARFLAGGQSLIPTMNFRLARPSLLIDINGLTDLAGVGRSDKGGVRVGALTRYRDLERNSDFLKVCPLFADALPHIAHPQIRNRGTIGGNLSHADPASELPALAVAMQARMRIKSSTGGREVPASEFFMGLLTTDIGSDEMLVEITYPASKPRTGTCFQEVARRRGDFALAGVAAIVTLDEERQECTDEAIDAVAAEVQGIIDPSGNVHATADYQRHIAGVLTRRTLNTALQRAGHGV
jgi:CO/xanthine dehydrogenase FAD-binding subunit